MQFVIKQCENGLCLSIFNEIWLFILNFCIFVYIKQNNIPL
jgi:hypothetical protein